jgi:aminopeptidase YwaD
VVLLVLLLPAVACTSDRGSRPEAPAVSTGSTDEGSPSSGSSPSPDPQPARMVRPGDLRPRVAEDAVRHLAGSIGPRHATSPAYRRAAAWVAAQFRGYGLDVRRQRFAVPGGVSWGVPVDAGPSTNIVAMPPGLDPRRPHLLLSAHLDTVPQAPGAEDDASGVGVLLATADAVSDRRTRLPVVLVAFGAEEPRGPTDADHHYGSRAYVASLGPPERRAVRGMLSLDRVGVGGVVPVCTAGDDAARAEALRAGERAQVPTVPCDNRSSDHWSFVRAGMPGVRIGGTPYAAYHSAADVPAVVNPAQLRRTGRLVLSWLGGPAGG